MHRSEFLFSLTEIEGVGSQRRYICQLLVSQKTTLVVIDLIAVNELADLLVIAGDLTNHGMPDWSAQLDLCQ
jgi:3',5'-cyclic AMP phosphodiesterase CpdA